MVKVSIAGATGYTGLELLRLLSRHPRVEIATLTSETYSGKSIAEVFPSVRGVCDHRLVPLDDSLGKSSDIIFLALPHTAAMAHIPAFLERPQTKVIDLSADFRLKDPEVFAQWYHTPHTQVKYLGKAVYGLPELYRDKIKDARLIANPGCYPTSIILGLAPLARTAWADLDSIIADSKSGVTGAGRKAALHTQFCECNEGVAPYGLGSHRHTPEVEQALAALAGRDIRITFSPHLMPMNRGILSTIYINLKHEISAAEITEIYRNFYKNEPFVRVLNPGEFASTHHVVYSNYCDIGVHVETRATRRAIITTAIDNLVKGASGQAVQNMNLLLGCDEKTALDSPGVFP